MRVMANRFLIPCPTVSRRRSIEQCVSPALCWLVPCLRQIISDTQYNPNEESSGRNSVAMRMCARRVAANGWKATRRLTVGSTDKAHEHGHEGNHITTQSCNEDNQCSDGRFPNWPTRVVPLYISVLVPVHCQSVCGACLSSTSLTSGLFLPMHASQSTVPRTAHTPTREADNHLDHSRYPVRPWLSGCPIWCKLQRRGNLDAEVASPWLSVKLE